MNVDYIYTVYIDCQNIVLKPLRQITSNRRHRSDLKKEYFGSRSRRTLVLTRRNTVVF
jgi:hypothetical protein